MLVKHLTWHEWEVVVFLSLLHSFFVTLSQLVVELFLVVEEQELVLQDIRASHLNSILLFHFSFDSLQSFFLFLKLIFFLLLCTVKLFTHLNKMSLEDFFVSLLLSKCNLLAKLEDVSRIFTYLWSSWWFDVPRAKEVLSQVTLRIWIGGVIVLIVSWRSPTELSNWRGHHRLHRWVSWMHSWFFHVHTDTMSVQEFFAVLPLNKILGDHQISYLEV